MLCIRERMHRSGFLFILFLFVVPFLCVVLVGIPLHVIAWQISFPINSGIVGERTFRALLLRIVCLHRIN